MTVERMLGEIQSARLVTFGRTGNVVASREVHACTSLDVGERVGAVRLNAGHGATR